jgi:cellulose synthase/poly-beta-1,6-N-acetylglucosamine synthase-like glycosyltransferase
MSEKRSFAAPAASLLGVITLLLVFPLLHAALVTANFIAHIIVLGLQLAMIRLSRPMKPGKTLWPNEPFVSIHVPAHNEPPELLRQTLFSLSQLQWQNFEVLVIDNNTTDENLWRPVEEYCKRLGPQFRFFHVEGLPGFKAGAMNYVRKYMDHRAGFIFVVDADYVVRRDAISRALRYFSDPNIGLVQFPQDYRNTGPGNIGLALDFKHFFSGYMNMANALNCVPSTGTLTFLRVAALNAVGGFGTEIVTEDADLGFRLSLNGYQSVYANESIGQGVMPHDLESLKKQRWRWAFGNAQILKLNWKRILFGRELNWLQRLGFITHLTAWFNFNLIPSVSIIVLMPLVFFGKLTVTQDHIVTLSGFTLMTYMVMRFGTMFYSLRREGHPLREIWLAYFTHVGLGWVSSVSWLKCLWDHRSPFVRTNKFIGKIVPGPLKVSVIELLLGVSLLAACATMAFTDFFLGPIAAILMAAARFLIYLVWRQTRYTMVVTKEMSKRTQRRHLEQDLEFEAASAACENEAPLVG